MSGLTRDDVVRMAREIFGQSAVLPVPELERFAAMAYAAGQAAELEKAQRVVNDQSVAALIEDRNTWKARAEFSYRQRDELTRQISAAVAAERESCGKTRAGKPRQLQPCGTGAFLSDQQYCFDKGWKEGAASVRAAIRARGKGEAL